jgi:serine/threonine protein kinase
MGAEVLDGKYALEQLLGRGGMGEVYAGKNLVTGKRVAIKRMRDLHELKEDVQARFLREARASSVIEHANVVQVFDVGRVDGSLYMVMELLRGESLASFLAREGPIAAARAAELLLPILRALEHAHARDVIHRDLKPDNIFLCEVEGADATVPKLLDFGIAKIAHDPEVLKLTRTGAVMGTPYYMSPEQAQDSGEIDARSDVYAMGVIFYEALGGKRPFEGANYPSLIWAIVSGRAVPLEELVPSIEPQVAACVARAMAPDRDHRYPSARAFADALREALRLPQRAVASAPTLRGRDALGSAETLPSEPEPATPYASVRPVPIESGSRGWRWMVPASVLLIPGAVALSFALGGSGAGPSDGAASRPPDPGAPEAEPAPITGRVETEVAEVVHPPVVPRRLEVTSDPPGASIEVDGERRCTSPCAIEVGDRAVTVVASRDGYEDASAELSPPFSDTPVSLHLARLRSKRPAREAAMMEAESTEPAMTEGLPFMDR